MTEQPPRTLADLRKDAELTQQEVAERMGVNQPRVSQIERDYPNLHLTVVSSYIQAIGGQILLADADGRTAVATEVQPTHWDAESLAKIRERRRQGTKIMNAASAPTEKLPLQGDQPEPGSDHTGGQVDHPNPESDQGDSGQRQEP